MAGLEKWAALTDDEKAIYRKVIQNQAKFDQMAGGGQMDEAQKELHRQNTERLKMFNAKKKDDKAKIPGWAMNPEGEMPGGSSRSRYGGATGAGPAGGATAGRRGPSSKFDEAAMKFRQWATKNPRMGGLAAGGILGGAYGAASGALTAGVQKTPMGKIVKKEQLKEYEDKPVSRYMIENPVRGSTGAGALVGAGAGLGGALTKRNPMLGAAIGALVPGVGLSAADKYLGWREKQQTPKKPTKAPVNTPAMPEAA